MVGGAGYGPRTLRLTGLWLTVVLCCGGVLTSEEGHITRTNPELSLELSELGYELEDPRFVEQMLQQGATSRAERYNRVRRSAVLEDRHLWTNGVIPYYFTEKMASSNILVENILESMAHIEARTCVRFRRLSEDDVRTIPRDHRYVNFVVANTCQSAVGMSGSGGHQEVSLQHTCASTNKIIHELGHLLGLWHEHARYDRDNNVLVQYKNIKDSYEYNFDKVQRMRLMAPYDLSSIMHYSTTTFANGGATTLKPFEEDLTFLVGYRPDLSFYDGLTLNTLYTCNANCGPDSPTCENSGYLSEHCTCVCPKGITGSRCQDVVTGYGCGGVINVWSRTEVTSPRYPGNYPDNANCTWLIESPPRTIMELTMLDFNLERSSHGTCRDPLEIRSHHIGIDRGPTYCGPHFNKTVTSISNHMILHFLSNAVDTRRGFRAEIRVLPKPDCSSSPCQNGGLCWDIPEIDTYYCHCRRGWVGHECNVHIVDGQWSEWSEWQECKAPCGQRSRHRTCSAPEPRNGGLDCEGVSYENAQCGSPSDCQDSLVCDFSEKSWGHDLPCGLIQDREHDSQQWMVHTGATPSKKTGPSAGHTTGDPSDRYIYLESSDGKPYDAALAWAPQRNRPLGLYCVQFFYHMYGTSTGSLVVLRKLSEKVAVVLWQRSGNQGNAWQGVNLEVLLDEDIELGFMAVRGNGYSSDIAMDDLSISQGGCAEDSRVTSHGYGCEWGDRRYSLGKFSVFDGCTRVNCFCNPDGYVDCPKWQKENICSRGVSLDLQNLAASNRILGGGTVTSSGDDDKMVADSGRPIFNSGKSISKKKSVTVGDKTKSTKKPSSRSRSNQSSKTRNSLRSRTRNVRNRKGRRLRPMNDRRSRRTRSLVDVILP